MPTGRPFLIGAHARLHPQRIPFTVTAAEDLPIFSSDRKRSADTHSSLPEMTLMTINNGSVAEIDWPPAPHSRNARAAPSLRDDAVRPFHERDKDCWITEFCAPLGEIGVSHSTGT